MRINLQETGKDLLYTIPPKTKERLTDNIGLVDQTLTQMRNSSFELWPIMLDDLGLDPTLRSYYKTYKDRFNFKVGFDVTGLNERIASDLETMVFRIVQEALGILGMREHLFPWYGNLDITGRKGKGTAVLYPSEFLCHVSIPSFHTLYARYDIRYLSTAGQVMPAGCDGDHKHFHSMY